MDEIRVKNLEVFCHHGVYKEENVLGQKFLVNIVSKVAQGLQERQMNLNCQ